MDTNRLKELAGVPLNEDYDAFVDELRANLQALRELEPFADDYADTLQQDASEYIQLHAILKRFVQLEKKMKVRK